jgi:oxygen-independent coproporphyrinogen-3 oxidase
VRSHHLYVHVPFCARRCSYCDFSIAVRREVPVTEFVGAVEREMHLRAPGSDRWAVDTLYLGGGTPSRLGGEGVARLIDVLARRAQPAGGAEVTLEANPEDVTPDSARAWRAAGVNRVSLGAQSFDDGVLHWMHRVHDAAAIGRAMDHLREAGIDNLSLDLIFALPEALERDWERDLEHALALAPDHVSLYGLTIEPHTPLGRWRARGETTEAPEERYERDFLAAHHALGGAGFEHYEVSNYARPGRASRHNSAYWTGVAYDALGPSAHGYDGDERYWNVVPYTGWLSEVHQGRTPEGGRERLDESARDAERVYLGLRTSRGLEVTGAEFARVERWIEAGWARMEGDRRLVLTPTGWLRLDALAGDLTVARSRY